MRYLQTTTYYSIASYIGTDMYMMLHAYGQGTTDN